MVLKRGKADNRMLFIDASAEYEKVTNNNRLREHHIKKIVDAFVSRGDIDHFARCVPYEEVSGNDYNLSVSTYVQPEDTREVIDIKKLNAEIEEIVAREQILRDEIAKIISEIEVDG
jgi:Type I restriction-modification system methyltransferase subunit